MSIDYATNICGDIAHEGKTIHLTNEAVAENYHGYGDVTVRYYASGVDDNGDKYRIAWDTTDEWDARDPEYYVGDAEEACDWDNPVEIRKMEGE